MIVDATGLRCPLPVIRLARAAKDAADGTEIVLLSTDPAAGPDVVAWCRMRGQQLLAQEQEGDVLRSTVRVRAAPAAAAPPAPPPGGAGTPPG